MGTVFPRGELGQRWHILAVAFTGLIISAASLPVYGIGSFVLPLQNELGLQRSSIQASVFFVQGGCALGGLFIGYILARIRMRPLVIASILGVSLSFTALALLPFSLPFFYLSFFAIALLGCGTIPVVWCDLVTAHFKERRGLALAIALTGTGVAGAFVPFLLASVISQAGWRAGFLALAILPLLIALPVTIAWMPKETGKSAVPTPVDDAGKNEGGFTLGQAIRSYRFYILCLSVVLIYLSITGILTNFIPAMSSRGMAAETAAAAQGGFAISLIAGRLGIGWLIDRLWGPGVAALALIPAALGAFMLVADAGFLRALVGMALVGVAAGAELDVLAYLTSRYFGLRRFSSIYGVLYAFVAIAGASGPVLFAWLQEYTASYDDCFLLTSAMLAAGGMMMFLLGPYPRSFPDTR